MALSCKHRQPALWHSGLTTQRGVESLHRCRTEAYRGFRECFFLHVSGGLHSFCIFELGFAIFTDESPQGFVFYTKLHYSRVGFGQPCRNYTSGFIYHTSMKTSLCVAILNASVYSVERCSNAQPPHTITLFGLLRYTPSQTCSKTTVGDHKIHYSRELTKFRIFLKEKISQK